MHFENFASDQLDLVLCKFFTEARSVKGELYKTSSLISIKHGINRNLSNSNSGLDIVNGSDFKKS